MKGHNQCGDGNYFTFMFLKFVQLMYGTFALEMNSIILEFSSLTDSNKEMDLL